MQEYDARSLNLDDKIRGFLRKFSKKEYTEKDIREAEKKADSVYKAKLGEVWNKVRLLFEIAKHPSLWGAQYAVMATLAVIYLVSPIDAVPDFIPVGGLADDIAVIGFMIAAVIKGVKAFTREKKLELRESIPEDLRSLYDSLMGLSPDDVKGMEDKPESKEHAAADAEDVPENKTGRFMKRSSEAPAVSAETEAIYEEGADFSVFEESLSEKRKERILREAGKRGQNCSEDDVRRIEEGLGAKNKGPIAAIWDKVMSIWDYLRENHSTVYKAMIIGALLYLIAPVDVIPDMIPVIGLVDDAFAIGAVYNAIFRPAARRVAEKAAEKLDPIIAWEVSQYLDIMHYRRLASAMLNLVLYVFAILFAAFPVFGLLPSSIISAVFILWAIGFAVFRLVRLLMGGHAIPFARTVFRERSVKRGIAEYVRSLGIRGVVPGEKAIDTFFRLAGDPVNERFLDRFIDHCWKLTKRDIARFILVEACIAAGFFILRHALLMQIPGLSFWQIVLHPFIVIAQSL